MEDERIVGKNLIMFPLGTVGRDMMYNLVTSYLLTFVLFTHKLTAAQVSAVTAIMVSARVFDALNGVGLSGVRVMAKVENWRGFEKLDEILAAADEICVARGDLGNAMPLWELPRVQKEAQVVSQGIYPLRRY